jgi:hypothetical protein
MPAYISDREPGSRRLSVARGAAIYTGWLVAGILWLECTGHTSGATALLLFPAALIWAYAVVTGRGFLLCGALVGAVLGWYTPWVYDDFPGLVGMVVGAVLGTVAGTLVDLRLSTKR